MTLVGDLSFSVRCGLKVKAFTQMLLKHLHHEI
jgi:hypothetical protein